MPGRMGVMVAVGLYLSLVGCVFGRSLTATPPDSTAVVVFDEDHFSHAVAKGWRYVWTSLSPGASGDAPHQRGPEQLVRRVIPTADPFEPARRSLRKSSGGGGKNKNSKMKKKDIGLIVAGGVAVIFAVGFRCWCWRKKQKDPNWTLTDTFKR